MIKFSLLSAIGHINIARHPLTYIGIKPSNSANNYGGYIGIDLNHLCNVPISTHLAQYSRVFTFFNNPDKIICNVSEGLKTCSKIKNHKISFELT